MPWFKVDDGLHSHPKAMAAGLEAMGLWVLMGSYCGFYVGQRGHITRVAARRVAGSARTLDRCAKRLVDAGLWHEEADGWSFHEWVHYQPTPESLQEERDRKARAGQMGGLAKARAKHANDTPEARDEHGASTTLTRDEHGASAPEARSEHDVSTTNDSTVENYSGQPKQLLADGVADPSGADIARPVPSRPDPTEERKDSPIAPKGAPSSDAPKREKRTRAGSVLTSWPEGFAVSPAIAKMCREEGLPNPYDVIRDFESAARAKGYKYADWEAAFRKWMRSPITRRDYDAWEPPSEPQAAIEYGPPAIPTADQLAILDRIRPKTALLAEAAAADVGAPVFFEPQPKPGGAG